MTALASDAVASATGVSRTGLLAGLAAGALWGVVFVAPRMVEGFGSVDFTVGRFMACGVFSAAMWWWRAWRARRLGTVSHPTPAQFMVAIGLSLLGYTGYYLLLVLGIADAGSVLPTLIVGTIPIWVMVLGKPVGLRWPVLMPGLLLTAAGLGVLMYEGMLQAQVAGGGDHGGWAFARGLTFAVAAMMSWTLFALLNANWLKRHPGIGSADWASWLGVAAGMGALVLWAVAGSSWQELTRQPQWWTFVGICTFTGIGAAWVASVLWNVASRHLSASLAGQLVVSETVFGILYSFAWDGRWPEATQAWACVLFVLGILASVRAHR